MLGGGRTRLVDEEPRIVRDSSNRARLYFYSALSDTLESSGGH